MRPDVLFADRIGWLAVEKHSTNGSTRSIINHSRGIDGNASRGYISRNITEESAQDLRQFSSGTCGERMRTHPRGYAFHSRPFPLCGQRPPLVFARQMRHADESVRAAIEDFQKIALAILSCQ